MLARQFHVAQRADEASAGVAGNMRGLVRMIEARGLSDIGDRLAGRAMLRGPHQRGKGAYEQRHVADGAGEELAGVHE